MKISVCIATFNGEKYIIEQISSILPQLRESDEIVISDDSSSDNTIELVKRIGDKRIKIFENQKFESLIFNFEFALKKASGDFIFLCDQDDIWFKNKVKIMLDYLLNYDLVVSDCVVVNDKLEVLYPSFFESRNSRKGPLHNFIKNSYLGCCMAFNRKLLNKALPFPKKIPMHDWWIGMIGEIYFKPFFLHEKLIMYRRHSNTASVTAHVKNKALTDVLKFRVDLTIALILRFFKG